MPEAGSGVGAVLNQTEWGLVVCGARIPPQATHN